MEGSDWASCGLRERLVSDLIRWGLGQLSSGEDIRSSSSFPGNGLGSGAALGNWPDITGDGVRDEVREEMVLIGFQDSGVESLESLEPRAGGDIEPWDEIMGGAVDSISNLSEMSESPRQFSCLPEDCELWEESRELGKLENWPEKSVRRE